MRIGPADMVMEWKKKMGNGRQIAEINEQTFATWLASKTDSDFKKIVTRGQLSRTEIANECGLSKSSLNQNPRIRASLRELEVALRQRGVLPTLLEVSTKESQEPSSNESAKPRGTVDAERLCRLETENATLRAEVSVLKQLLEKYAVLSEALSQTGRLPR